MHHKVFDLGAFTILPDTCQIVFCQHLNGSDEAARMLGYQGTGLILPQPEFPAWHRKEVFKSPARA